MGILYPVPFIVRPYDRIGIDRPGTFRRDTPKIGRNEPCLCGSGKKYKRCCIEKGGDIYEGASHRNKR